MKEKVQMGLILTLCLILCLVIEYFSSYVFDVIILILSLCATIEFKKLQLKAGYPSFDYCPEIVCFLMFVTVFTGCLCGLPATWILIIIFGIMILAYLIVFLGSFLLLKKELESDPFKKATNMSVREFAFFKANNTISCIIYPNLAMFFIYFLNHISGIGLATFVTNTAGIPMNLFALVLLFAVACLSDTFAMIFGSLIGGIKIFPRISPRKTLTGCLFGLLGGLLGSILSFWIFSLIFKGAFVSVAWLQIALVGILGSVISQAGDLFESSTKRRAEIKDSGDFFRSHGGVLDRFDSIIFCAPFIFICLLLIFG